MRRTTPLLLALALAAACAATAPTGIASLPAWLTTRIDQLESQPVANPPALIARYEYRGQVVYYLPPRCCDIPSDLYDSAGAIICHPDGGLFGGDARCCDFITQRTNEKIVWRDPRE